MSDEHKIKNPADMVVHAQPMVGHPGPFIRDTLIGEYGLSVSALARAIEVNRPNLVNVLDGKTAVSNQLAYKLGALMRDEVADLLIEWQHRYTLESEKGLRAAIREGTKRLRSIPETVS